MRFGGLVLAAFVSAWAPTQAAFYQGTVQEARFGMGIDSVRVRLAGSTVEAYSDSAGRFALTATALRNSPRERSELIWFSQSRVVAWTGVTGKLTLIVADAAGRTVARFASGRSAGRFQLPALGSGIYFTCVHAMGGMHSWRWNAGATAYSDPGAVLPQSPNLAFPLGKKSGTYAAAQVSDSLVFEKKGFVPVRRALAGSAMNLDVKMAREPIKVLIVDGIGNHDWKQTSKIVQAVYGAAGYFSVTTSTAPAVSAVEAWSAWRPDFQAYEVVLMNYNPGASSGLAWPRDKQMLLEEYVKGGGGLYIFHSANNAFPDWIEYNKMIGTGWRNSDFGTALTVEASGAVMRIPAGTGDGTSHGNRADAPIHILNHHPINRGYPDVYLASTLEIYQYARGPAENCEVLSYAYDGPASGGSNLNWPIEILINYGKGQVYNATPGHVGSGQTIPNAVRDVSFQTTLIRATEWLARKEILYPVPAEFNSATKVVFHDLALP